MSDNNRLFFKDVNKTKTSEPVEELYSQIGILRKKIDEYTLEEQELKQQLAKLQISNESQMRSEEYLDFAIEKANETVRFIKENTEREIRETIENVKNLKAEFEKESKFYDERIKRKKQYIVSMLQSLLVFMDDDKAVDPGIKAFGVEQKRNHNTGKTKNQSDSSDILNDLLKGIDNEK